MSGKKENKVDLNGVQNPDIINKQIKDLLSAYNDLEKSPESERKNENKAQLAGNLATLYWKLDNFSEARKYYIIALNLYEKIEDEYHIASVYGALGSMYLQIKEFDGALRYTEKAFNYWKKKPYLNERLACYQNLALIYRNLNKMNKASDFVISALKMAIKLQDEHEFARSIQILLEYYEIEENYPMLLELKMKALEFWESLHLDERTFKTLIDIGVLYQVLEQHESAMLSFKKAFNVVYNIGDLEKMFLAQGFIGEAHFNKKDVNNARKVYIESFKLAVYIAELKKTDKYPAEDFERINRMKLILLSLGLSEHKVTHLQKEAENEAKKTINHRDNT